MLFLSLFVFQGCSPGWFGIDADGVEHEVAASGCDVYEVANVSEFSCMFFEMQHHAVATFQHVPFGVV